MSKLLERPSLGRTSLAVSYQFSGRLLFDAPLSVDEDILRCSAGSITVSNRSLGSEFGAYSRRFRAG